MAGVTGSDAGVWPRWRLLATLGGIAATILFMLVGLGYAVYDAITEAGAPTASATTASDGTASHDTGNREGYRDRVAAAPMLQVSAADAATPGVATSVPQRITIPASRALGPAGVPSGFPRTPEGAVAQLAAIEVRVFEAMSIPEARDVHAAWVVDGGPSFAAWDLTRSVQAFLTAARLPGAERDESVLIAATPAAGLVKGADGPDWVVACVLLDVQASVVADARVGYGHCARMAWRQDRWLIASGPQPARAPSVWPGSEQAIVAGWRAWTLLPREGTRG